jgi:hypothetical protein
MLRFWSKLLSLPDNRYAKIAYIDALELYQTKPKYSPWCLYISCALSHISMGGHFEFQSIPNFNAFYSTARDRFFEKYKNDWFTEILTYTSLKNFRRFKTSHGLEKYFTIVKNPKHRVALTRFRLRSHNLAIETGRHNNIPREDRFCEYCDADRVEDEIHFLLFCSFYDELRRPLIPFIQNLNKKDAFVFLLNSTAPHITKLVAKFVYLAFTKRSKYNETRS